MSLRPIVAILVLSSLASFTPRAGAQPQPGDLGIFADATGTLSIVQTAPFVPFDVYVVTFDLPEPIGGYEFRMDVGTTSDLVVLGWTTFPPDPPLVIAPIEFPDFFVGLGNCIGGPGPLPLARVTFFPVSGAPHADHAICLSGTVPSSFSPSVPGYRTCADELVPFGVAQNGGDVYPDGCLILDPTVVDLPIATESLDFGTVKSRY